MSQIFGRNLCSILLFLWISNATAQNYHYSTFSYTEVSTNRYATALPSSIRSLRPYALAPSSASKVLPQNITFTTWSLNPQATATPDGAYGQSAYARLWAVANLTYSSTVPFTTTQSPTPVPSSELVFPPPLYNAPMIDASLAYLKLPADFIWGVAGSAWQIEGGLTVEGRGPSNLDLIGALPNPLGLNNSVTATMNYFLYKQDIARLAAIGIPYYSFSIEWSRVMPFYFANTPVNEQALDHYDDLINTCLEYGITPIATMVHGTMPIQANYTDPFVPAFLYYAKIITARYADRVPIWITFNEPNIAIGGYNLYQDYNGYTEILMAHAELYHWYKNSLQGTGQISIKFANNLAVPLLLNDSTHVAAAQRYQEFLLGIIGNPVFLGTQYPSSVLSTKELNLRPLTSGQLALINGTCDFLSLDPYVAQLVSPAEDDIEACISNKTNPLWPQCVEATSIQANGWLIGRTSQSYPIIAPQYVRQQLGYLWSTFQPKGILISEFGFPDFAESTRIPEGQRFDLDRTLYYQDFLGEVLKSVHWDSVNIIGALAWSFVDNNEFGSMETHFGMQTVNHTDGKFTRTYKRSMFDFVDFFHQYVAHS